MPRIARHYVPSKSTAPVAMFRLVRPRSTVSIVQFVCSTSDSVDKRVYMRRVLTSIISGSIGWQIMGRLASTVACPCAVLLRNSAPRVALAGLPNTRLKLSAPVPNASSGHVELRCARLSFVNIHVRRRSLSAIR
jgi:hypothetical protein